MSEYLMRSSFLLLSKADKNIIETWYVKGTDLCRNIIAIESNFQPHWVFYIRYSICDVPDAHTQIGLISDTGDSYIQLVMTAEVPEPTFWEWAKEWRGGSLRKIQSTPVYRVKQIHLKVKQVKSSLITQMRTEKIGLKAFLHSRRVPDIYEKSCQCGATEQTARHSTNAVYLTRKEEGGGRKKVD